MAVDRLNKIREDRQLTSGENSVLAYVYHAEGRWPEAQRLMIDILAKNPNNPGYITTYIEWLLEREELADAAAWIRKLNPNSVEASPLCSHFVDAARKSQGSFRTNTGSGATAT